MDNLFLGFFVVELTLRLAAVGFRPDRFLRRGWNVFDLIAVGASFVPGLGSNATALRLVRLLRVARLLSVLPDVKVLLDGLRRAARRPHREHRRPAGSTGRARGASSSSVIDRGEAFEEARDAAPEFAPREPAWSRACARLTDDRRFGALVITVILLNALTLGMATFPAIESSVREQFRLADDAFLSFFCLELVVRLAAVGFRPDLFLRRGWSLFDLLAVGASFVPGLGANATALRVARLLSVLPDVRVSS